MISQHVNQSAYSLPLAIGLFVSVSVLASFLCAKQRRSRLGPAKPDNTASLATAPKSPARQLLTAIGNKATSPFKKRSVGFDDQESQSGFEFDQEPVEVKGNDSEASFGEGGLWQKSILMGDKCRPPEFSGVIYYDSSGNQVAEQPPRSPRVSPLPSSTSRTNAYI